MRHLRIKIACPSFAAIAIVIVQIAILSGNVIGETPLRGEARWLYNKGNAEGRFFEASERLRPEIYPTSDGKSFSVIYRESKNPTHWIVSLHGAGRPAKGFATDDLAIWHRHIEGRPIGIICIQWWLGTGDGVMDFYKPDENYREIARALEHVGVEKRPVLLHGFSRGSTNTFSLAALDVKSSRHYFSLIVASSGGYNSNYPPNRALDNGEFGKEPLKGTRWYTVAGGRDPNAERDGIPGMRLTADWLRKKGATVIKEIEDSTSGHGAFHLNKANADLVLDYFMTLGRG